MEPRSLSPKAANNPSGASSVRYDPAEHGANSGNHSHGNGDSAEKGQSMLKNPSFDSGARPSTVVTAMTRFTEYSRSAMWRKGTTGTTSKMFNSQREDKVLRGMRHFAIPILETKVFQVLFGGSLMFALFGSPLFALADVPDDPGVAWLDGLMCFVGLFFIADVVLRSMAYRKSYFLSYFFVMDIVGTASMLFEISFFLGDAGKMQTMHQKPNTMLLRVARAAKVGARAGRFAKVLKCISYIHADKQVETEQASTAKVLTKRLMLALSTKVSVLTVVLVLGTPLFSIGTYPEEDMSMRYGTVELEDAYYMSVEQLTSHANADTTDLFERSVTRFRDLYVDNSYFPYRIEGWPEEYLIDDRRVTIPGAGLLSESNPPRNQNIMRQMLSVCLVDRPDCFDVPDGPKASIYFNFSGPAHLQAIFDILIVCFIIAILVLESFDLTYCLDTMLVKPMERMLDSVRKASAQILDQVSGFHNVGDLSDMNEAALLELVVAKLSHLSGQYVQKKQVKAGELNGLDNDTKGVFVELMQLPQVASREGGRKTTGVHFASDEEIKHLRSSEMPVNEASILSWDFDLLNTEQDQLPRIVLHLFYESRLGRAITKSLADATTFHRFHDQVKAGYLDNPYHNYTHGVDVTVSTFRMMTELRCQDWLSEVELFALMVSALCHDIGHVGKTNQFLVETKDQLALLYNDKSPLENMHCARLFEICQKQGTNIFEQFDAEMYKQARKVCISSILNTDNANHFDMVKEVNKVYTVQGELCDWVARLEPEEPVPDNYTEEVLSNDKMLWLSLFLHLCDIANPIKGFDANRSWAMLVCDEFFAQGDEEKRMGLPVGMLNDREKVSRDGSQHGFIVFLVAPLVVASTGVFPAMQVRADQMAYNLEEWRKAWVEAASPTAEDVAKRVEDIKKVRDQVGRLRERALNGAVAQRPPISNYTTSVSTMNTSQRR